MPFAARSSAPSPSASRRNLAARASHLVRGGTGDRFAIGLSGLCMVHCLISALFLASVASVGSGFLNPLFHEIGLCLAVLLGLGLLITGARRHGRILPLIIGGSGLVIMAFALTMPHDSAEIITTLTGVALLAFGHELNRRAGRIRA